MFAGDVAANEINAFTASGFGMARFSTRTTVAHRRFRLLLWRSCIRLESLRVKDC
jgi:hypothetical protein